ncbi:MAG: hypothetical protein M0Z46_11130 [Actinomycetota bacterium]|nr:hypothetical protein [Actinomycetota bacterium]MDA8357769.1 hypothetical protein [Actinomycetota bacterium]
MTGSLSSVVGVTLFPPVSGASLGTTTCPHGKNYESTACFYGKVQYGDFTEFHNNYMHITATKWKTVTAHVNQSLWAYSTSPCTYWMEIGLTDGFKGNNVYTWYWAYQRSGKSGGGKLTSTTWNGTNHTYEVLYNGNRTYGTYLDFTHVGTFVSTLGYGTCKASAGLEAYKNQFGYEFATTFTLNPLQWEDTGGTWHSGWTAKMYWLDYPCSIGTNKPPYCMNGTYYGANQWSDNKP